MDEGESAEGGAAASDEGASWSTEAESTPRHQQQLNEAVAEAATDEPWQDMFPSASFGPSSPSMLGGANKCDPMVANLASGLASNDAAKQKEVVEKAEEWAFREEAPLGCYWMLARALPAMVRFLTTPTATPQHQYMCGLLLSILNQPAISEAEDFKEEMAECGMLEVLQACLFNEELAVDDRENAAGTLLNFCSVSQERQEKDKRCVAQLYKLCFLDLVVAVRYGEDMASAVRLACARVITQMLNSGETATEWSILKWARLRRPNPHPDPDPKV